MAQKVIAARDFDLYINFDAIGTAIKIETGTNFTANITGTTEDIHAFSHAEPIATDNGDTNYDLNFSMQQAEALAIKDALAAATAGNEGGSIAHIRQLIEAAVITAVWHKRRDVPATSTIETYTNCTGMEENDAVERSATETLKTWSFRARGMQRTTVPL